MGKKLNKTAKSECGDLWNSNRSVGSDDGAAESGNGIKLEFPACSFRSAFIRSWQCPLNLTVGSLGDLSLGHAGFMCVGAFASALFTNLAKDAIPMTWASVYARNSRSEQASSCCIWVSDRNSGIFVRAEDYLAIVTLAFG